MVYDLFNIFKAYRLWNFWTFFYHTLFNVNFIRIEIAYSSGNFIIKSFRSMLNTKKIYKS